MFDSVLKLFSTLCVTSKIQLIYVGYSCTELLFDTNLYSGMVSIGGCEARPQHKPKFARKQDGQGEHIRCTLSLPHLALCQL